MMNLARMILGKLGWKLNITVPDFPKCIICVAPHTSNWDFIIGKLAYMSIHRPAGFLMKSSWFFFPLGLFFKSIGGVPVYRKKKRGSLVKQLVERYKSMNRLVLAVTPEGTRSYTTHWHTGFLQIATQANIPIVLGKFDYKNKVVDVSTIFEPTGDILADMHSIKIFYRGAHALYPEKFSAEDD